ncbi:MAG: TlpA family protein disulfide reductase [Candidatus Omnitrophota bacterium]|jgi:peroxiredoxin|nr:MAG: TlpA family protein disulfide reductase [Candidatus Omnitrophota bacterium]
MRKLVLILAFFVFVNFSVVFGVGEKPVSKAVDFELIDTHDDLVKLSSYKDKQPVLLFFWTTWCPFCQKELRVLNSMYSQLLEGGVEVLSINVGESPDKVSNFIKNYYLAFRVLLDKDSAVARQFGILGVPTYLLVNKEGNIVFSDNFFPNNYKDLISRQEK